MPERLPSQTQLLANYPNPFNPETWIPFQLSQDAEVRLTIYDVTGKTVRKMQLGHLTAGSYSQPDRESNLLGWQDREGRAGGVRHLLLSVAIK